MNVLFVCTGNTCRSPIAEKILKKIAEDANIEIDVKSTGIAAIEGHTASKNARTVMKEYGTEVGHQTKRISKGLLLWADLVLTMTMHHKKILIEQEPRLSDKIHTLKEYIASQSEIKNEQLLPSLDVDDPFGGDLNRYRKTADEIEDSIKILIKMLKN